MRQAKLMDMAEKLRRHAAEVTMMNAYARKMLEAAAELEQLARHEGASVTSDAPLKSSVQGTLRCIG